MKNLYLLLKGSLLLTVLLFMGESTFSQSQVQTPRYIATGPNSNGFLEYLPVGYSKTTTRYPLMIFIHGAGELGDGGSELPIVMRNGPPKLIHNGVFPDSFVVNGKAFSFIVISPQFVAWPSDNDVSDVITYALAHYRVDTGRIYMTGLSMGGSATWAYADYSSQNASQLAAILPISGIGLWQGEGAAVTLANSNLAIFGVSNLYDNTVPSSNTIDAINMIDSVVPAIQPKAIDTIYNASGHDAWDVTYTPTVQLYHGMNVYQWMLQYTRDKSDTIPQPIGPYPAPVPDTVVWSSFTASLPTGQTTVNLSWSTSLVSNEPFFLVERAADARTWKFLDTLPAAAYAAQGYVYSAVDPNPLPDSAYYRIAAVFLDGKVSYSPLQKVVSTSTVKTPQDSVAWSSFTAVWPTGQSQVVLSLTTSLESNDKYFLIQRSANGQTFYSLDTIAAAPNAGSGHAYSAIDSTPLPDSDYYRVAVVFLDGKISYSITRKVVSVPAVQPPPDTVAWSVFTATWPAGQPGVTLGWTTTLESNDQYFLVQRSADGRTFNTVDTVQPPANAGNGHTYSAVDPNPLPDSDYYRIAAVFLDGRVSYSIIRKVVSMPPVQAPPDTVAWSAFTATWLTGQSVVVLNWTTTLEQNDSYFLLQRSQDGGTFNTIDTVHAAAGATNGHSYTTVDPQPLADSDYYRVAVVYLDGTISYSAVREVVSTAPPVKTPDSVILSSFTAATLPGLSEVGLNWTTTLEQNDRYFLVQRSADGRTFNSIDTVPAAAGATNGQTYSAIDGQPLADSGYYRLAIVYLDSTISYSAIREVVFPPASGDTLPPPKNSDTVVVASFTAEVLSGQTQVGLNWTTTLEQNAHYFLVQRSADGQTFNPIDSVPAADAQNGNSYSAVDPNPLADSDYYRLAIVYLDGTISYSVIREVLFRPDPNSFLISPNPAGGTLNLSLKNNASGTLDVRLLDIQGRTLESWAFLKQDELWTQAIDIGNLPPGSYIIQVIGSAVRVTRSFIKK